MDRGITFDFWNTLYRIQSHSVVSNTRAQKVGAILERHGYVISGTELQAGFHYAWEQAAYNQRACGYDMGPRGQFRCFQEKLQIQLENDTAEQVYQAYTRTLLDFPPHLNEGVAETLPALADRYRLAVICNTGVTPGAILRKFLAADGMDQYFQFMLFSDETGFAKPNPEIFACALRHLGCSPSRSAHIGDDPITDVIGAKLSGMTAIWLAPGQTWTVPEADYHVNNVKELLTLLE